MDKQMAIGIAAMVMGLVIILARSVISSKATQQRNVFGQMNAASPSLGRTMPLAVGGVILVRGVLVLTGVLGVQ
ncbi:hypothetical protein [Streptomyces sp. NPDC008141]|uniref:hypothetical protein n=1 Tax=Streptomyces sp. NPDC008141 TaxID=3364815 RepID=UPI0036EBE5C6